MIELFLFLLIAALSIPLYFLPSIVAYNKGHRNFTALFVLNLFLGWSIFGWVGALVWAFIESESRTDERSRSMPGGSRHSRLAPRVRVRGDRPLSPQEEEDLAAQTAQDDLERFRRKH